MMIFRRRWHPLRIAKLLCLSFVLTVILMNAAWLVDCDYCFGHICRFSLCEDYHEPNCIDTCYEGGSYDDIVPKSRKRFQFAPERSIYWQELAFSHYQSIYVYSAFSLPQDNQTVILGKVYYGSGETGKKYDDQFDCVFLDDGLASLSRSKASFDKYYQHFQHYEPTRIQCQSPTKNSKFVKLTHRTEEVESEPIAIHYSENSVSSKEPDIVVCVRPLFDSYDLVKNLLEFIAYYRVNGVDRFAFYVESATGQVLQLLSSMSTFVDLYPWILKDRRLEVGRENQISSIEDCLHRYRQSVVLLIDIDEFIVPFNHPTLKSFLLDESNRDTVVLSVNNLFFCCEFNQENFKAFPRILSHFNRDFSPWPRGIRSKMIVLKPDLVNRIDVHAVDSLIPSKRASGVKHVHPNDALMFHYRNCCGQRTPFLWMTFSVKTHKSIVVYDDRMNRFRDRITGFITNYISNNTLRRENDGRR